VSGYPAFSAFGVVTTYEERTKKRDFRTPLSARTISRPQNNCRI